MSISQPVKKGIAWAPYNVWLVASGTPTTSGNFWPDPGDLVVKNENGNLYVANYGGGLSLISATGSGGGGQGPQGSQGAQGSQGVQGSQGNQGFQGASGGGGGAGITPIAGYSIVVVGTGQYGQFVAPNSGVLTAAKTRPLGATLTANTIIAYVHAGGTSGAVTRLGIYADTGGYPGALILDSGPIDSTGNDAIISSGISQSLTAGNSYWLAALPQGSPVIAPTYIGVIAPAGDYLALNTLEYSWNLGLQYNLASVSNGALPSTFPTGVSPGGAAAQPTVVAVGLRF